MQLYNLIAATATPLVSLGNPGVMYIQPDNFPDPLEFSTRWDKNVRSVARDVANRGLALDIHTGPSPQQLLEPAAIMGSFVRLRSFEKWGDNWDGEGAPAPTKSNLDSAGIMLGFLHSRTGKVPRASLNSEGEPMLSIMDGDLEAMVTVYAPLEVAYLFAKGEKELAGVAHFDGRTMPVEISDALSEIRGVTA